MSCFVKLQTIYCGATSTILVNSCSFSALDDKVNKKLEQSNVSEE